MFKFSSKAKTLEYLSGKLTDARILPLLVVSSSDVRKAPQEVADRVQGFFKTGRVIVRSSARGEDTLQSSMAGHFISVAGVDVLDRPALLSAIGKVADSYGTSLDEDILLQPMLEGIAMAGVAFTADMDTLAPYYVINYDQGGHGDAITSGMAEKGETYIHFKGREIPAQDKRLERLIRTCQDIERLVENSCLDVEFAFTWSGELYIFQVRPLVTAGKDDCSSLELGSSLFKIEKKIEKLSGPHPSLLGNKVAFGVMPDWNPAEIIGLRPRALTLSLYRELVTDRVWAYQRDNYGYRNLRSHPLMVSFMGVPFIDIRVDFNSFIPKALPETTAAKLVDHYVDALLASPEYHDKVEFEIVHSCYYFGLRERLARLGGAGFSSQEISEIETALRDLTNQIIRPSDGLYRADLEKAKLLEQRYQAVMASSLPVIEKIYWLMEDAKRYGTLPFAGVARAAFIAVQILRSLVSSGILSQEDYDAFMNSLETVTRTMNQDLALLAEGQLSREVFLERYGHLRPGTYDILSPSYRDAFDRYFGVLPEPAKAAAPFSLTGDQRAAVDRLLTEHGLAIDAGQLFTFMREAITGRESVKYMFTRSLGAVLSLLEALGERVGLSVDELSHVDIRTVMDLYAVLDVRDVREIFCADIDKNRTLYAYTKAIRLPHLILQPQDVYGFFLHGHEPNYITMRSTTARVVREEDLHSGDISGSIVCVRSADPGYDFLFSKNIAGLITEFGGANSHMAIRCAEQGIPAVIGSGERNFRQWASAKMLEINCAARYVKVVV